MKYFISVLIAFVLLAMPVTSFAAGNFGLDETAQASGLQSYGSNLPQLIGSVIGTALSMISVLFFVLTVYGGVLWMTARGNEDQAKKALNTIIAASIGLIIVLSSYALTTFVFNAVGGNGGGAAGAGGGDGGGAAATADGELLAVCNCAVEYSFADNYNLDADGNENVCIFTRFPSGMTSSEKDSSCLQFCNGNSDITRAFGAARNEGLDAQVVIESINTYSDNDINRAISDSENICGPYIDKTRVSSQ
ncbi:MAG: hypothetical protein GW939_04145 [Candidatus Magasanikbacteria bacterium]|nr:hypothetical protein [Candidatus Magasanikbacteria bacterium]NCS72437.1 hypothetical protein [Candidatus Magasanikbacteria bacterium]